MVGCRATRSLLFDQGHETASTVLLLTWFVFCVYTWFAPVLFDRMLKKELSGVELSDRF
ncbi:MAG: hypothetical protein HY815_32260 [Candidatus Riflebacteria bacterium]|nr:hypothetical protein [Candidatus Riflebacteria bacterium]